MQSIRTWVFDLDGTLVDAMPYQEVIAAVAEMAGLQFKDLFAEYRQNFQGAAAMQRYHESLVPEADRPRVAALYEEAHASSANPELLDGSIAALEAVRSRGCRVLLWSKGDRDFQLAKLKRKGLADYFDDVIVSTAKGRPEAVVEMLLPAVDGPWAMVGDSYEQDIVPALPYATRAYWIQGGRANALARPETWAEHPKLVPIAHISELAAMLAGGEA